MGSNLRDHFGRTQALLLGAAAVCYGIGYPVALVGRSSIGWVFVSAGGFLLLALGVTMVRRAHRAALRADGESLR